MKAKILNQITQETYDLLKVKDDDFHDVWQMIELDGQAYDVLFENSLIEGDVDCFVHLVIDGETQGAECDFYFITTLKDIHESVRQKSIGENDD